MVKPSSHCPHVGLKQNRAIRFASPTAEHRCYVTGDAQEIPVDQANYCLCPEHVNCPLYMGLSMTSTTNTDRMTTISTPTTGIRGWLASLSRRDRIIYGTLLSVMLTILGLYIVLAVQLLLQDGGSESPAVDAASRTLEPTTAAVSAATTPTDTPAPTQPAPTDDIIVPTAAATDVPLTAATSTILPTDTPPSPTPDSAATAQQMVTLYFLDASNTLLVPINRQISPPNGDVAPATLEALFAGPLPDSNLNNPIPADLQLLDTTQNDETMTINLNRRPDTDEALAAMALTLTELPSVARVQFQVNGDDIGLDDETSAIRRLPLNIDNPQNLSTEFDSGTRFLPLYFMLDDYRVRVTRLVPRTAAIATATVEELLKGPDTYGNLLSSPIPSGTSLISIRPDGRQVTVDLSQQFAEATNRQAAIDVLVLSLTELINQETQQPFFDQVEILIEGRALSDVWGDNYNQVFMRPVLNTE